MLRDRMSTIQYTEKERNTRVRKNQFAAGKGGMAGYAKKSQPAKRMNDYLDLNDDALVRYPNPSIGVVVPTLMNPFFPKMLSGIAETARIQGYYTEVFNAAQDGGDWTNLAARFAQGRQQGLILAAPKVTEKIVRLLAETEPMPYVLTDQADDVPGALRVAVDDTTGGGLVVDHLVGLGHQRFAIVCPPQLPFNMAARYRSYLDALGRHGIPRNAVTYVSAPLTREAGQAAAARIVKLPGITAIITINDDLAIGVLKGLHELGKRIPHDYSVVGYDNTDLSNYVTPELTTVNQPVMDLGHAVADCLLAKIERREPEVPATLPVELVVRASSGRAKLA
ncbi:LacI family DNA-binding transcriptional regulator [Schleiferilactobacillus harbinensis]|uniref:LacI family DNA-binding transcriptional regulator n=1 Tax=Schleiferilactobacillus harbinensis TaxID=304207 RepID=UPI0039E9D2A7